MGVGHVRHVDAIRTILPLRGTSDVPAAVLLSVDLEDPGSAEFALSASGAGVAMLATRADAPDLTALMRPLRLSRDVGEAALVRAAQRGSQDAVEEIFSRHWEGAYRAALLITGDPGAAEDVAQEAFLSALRALPSFNLRQPLRPWLHRIVANRAIDWARARSYRDEVPSAAAPDRSVVDAFPGALGDDVMAALLELAPEQRAVIVLRYVLDLTPGEIAVALDLPRGTVNSRLRRGLDMLGDHVVEERG
jgi:RNA polymerase sigma-70 factor (ECF subfamily)